MCGTHAVRLDQVLATKSLVLDGDVEGGDVLVFLAVVDGRSELYAGVLLAAYKLLLETEFVNQTCRLPRLPVFLSRYLSRDKLKLVIPVAYKVSHYVNCNTHLDENDV